MKKFFTLLAAAAAALSMTAADFELYFGDEKAENGKTYTHGYTIDPMSNELIVIYIQDSNLFLHGVAGTDITVTCEADNEIQFCSIDGSCIMINAGQAYTKSGKLGMATPGTVEGEVITESAMIDLTTMDFDQSDPATLLKPITVKVTAYETNDPDNATTVTVVMTNEAAGIGSLSADDEYVRVGQGNVINYNVKEPATLQLYAITGNLVAKYPIANAGSVNLGSLSKGIYLFTAGKRTGKVIIR